MPWLRQLRAQNVPGSDEIIKVKAESSSSEPGIAEISKWSDGWLEKFKLIKSRIEESFITWEADCCRF